MAASGAELPLLLLPGLGCDERMWAPQVRALSKTGRAVSVMDIRAAYPLSTLAREILEDAPPRFALAGLSMGGIVAFEMWRQASERIAGLALLDTNPQAEDAARRAAREENERQVKAGLFEVVVKNRLAPAYFFKPVTALTVTVTEMARALGPQVFLNQWRALSQRADSVPTLTTITVPTLVLCGEQDALCPVALHELMAKKIPGATLEVVAGCGHIATLERPAAVTGALEGWLARLG